MDNINYTQGLIDFNNIEFDIDYRLTKYGIFEENSDIRAHVSKGIIFVFKTCEVINAIKLNNCEKKYAFQSNYDNPTALGYIVKQDLIKDIRKLNFVSWDGWELFNPDWRTTDKGKWAISCVTELIKNGRFPFWLDVEQTKDVKIDINGTDIIVAMNQKIQVKCDYPAKETGNLYIQTHEKNPFKFH